MDRLICDVGFGKTGWRSEKHSGGAKWKAVAMLVPTTVWPSNTTTRFASGCLITRSRRNVVVPVDRTTGDDSGVARRFNRYRDQHSS
jgi:hypothetical protein